MNTTFKAWMPATTVKTGLVMLLTAATFSVFLLQSCGEKDPVVVTGSIDGIVTNADNGEPIQAAEVMITPSGKTAITGGDGYYTYKELEAGEYTVQVRKNGFQSNIKRVTVQQGQTAKCDVVLHSGAGFLTVNKTALAFGTGDSNLGVFEISNSGQAAFDWRIAESCDWITAVSPSAGTLAAGSKQSVTVTISRPQDTKEHSYDLIIESNSGSAVVTVSVGGSGNGGDNTGGETGSIVVTGGLAAYYTFDDGTVKDVTGNGYDGSAINSPDYITDTPNGSGKAVFLRKANSQKLSLPNAVQSNMAVPYNLFYSICLWVKDAGNGNITTGEGSNSGKCLPALQVANGKFVVNDKNFDGANVLQDGNWHHIVIVYYANNDAGSSSSTSLYVDGGLYGNSTNSIHISTSVIYIGGALSFYGYTEANSFKVDNIRIYNRKLTANEVLQIYSAKQ